jgi:FtsP/CotA-like multicopper oxidase with cupredoxin domain
MKGKFRSLKAVCLLCVLAMLAGASTGAAVTRDYFIQAEDVTWDFAPSGQDLVHGGPIPAPYLTVWNKSRYIEYTDFTFSHRKSQPPWLGILGPIIRAEVGDTIRVKFRNRTADQHLGIHPHGVRYTKDNEGAHYLFAGAGAEIGPGEDFTYVWQVDSDAGPGPNDPSSIVWWYHAHVDEPRDTNRGLLGAIIITRRGSARSDGSPVDVDREFVTAFFIFNEDNDEEDGLMHSINGRIFGNLTGLTMRSGERVRWHLLGMGNEVDLHTPHWHGKTVNYLGHRTDVIELLPASMKTVDMKADNPGTWMYHCHVADHLDAGMDTLFTIQP